MDTTVFPEGPYTLRLTVNRGDGPKVATAPLTIDNTPPTMSFNSYVEGTGAQYQADDLGNPQLHWYNNDPAAGGTSSHTFVVP